MHKKKWSLYSCVVSKMKSLKQLLTFGWQASLRNHCNYYWPLAVMNYYLLLGSMKYHFEIIPTTIIDLWPTGWYEVSFWNHWNSYWPLAVMKYHFEIIATAIDQWMLWSIILKSLQLLLISCERVCVLCYRGEPWPIHTLKDSTCDSCSDGCEIYKRL